MTMRRSWCDEFLLYNMRWMENHNEMEILSQKILMGLQIPSKIGTPKGVGEMPRPR